MKKCGKSRCQICKYVDEGCNFAGAGNTHFINYSFDCDSVGVIYLITCTKCAKIYVGSTITSFRKRFNNHKSSLNRFGKGVRGVRGIAGEHLYAHLDEKMFKLKLLTKLMLMTLQEEKDSGHIN